MESEKVKEIKNTVRYFVDRYMTAQCIGVPKRELFAEILTLINELESENERLMKLQARGGCRVAELGIENQQLKDRIAELEKENDELKFDIKNSIDMQKQMLDGFKAATKEVEENLAREIPNLLKRFTERLIDKYGYDKLTHEPDEDIEIYLTASELDETLKEYE